MNFAWTEEQHLLVEQIESFAKGRLAPLTATWHDQEERVQDAMPLLAEQGLLGCCIPETDGGPGLDPAVLCQFLTTLARVNASLATQAAILNATAIEYLIHGDHSPQRQERLHSLLEQQQWIAWVSDACMPEGPPPAVHAIRTTQGWQLRGMVPFVTLGISAHSLLVFAQDEHNQRHAFWLQANHPGIERQVVRGKLGLRSTDIAHIRLHEVEVSPTQQIGPDNDVRLAEITAWNKGRIALAAVALGIGQAAHQQACLYAQQRKQFGAPLASFQAIQWKIAEGAMDLEAATCLLYRAISAWQHQQPEDLERWAGMAATFSSQAALRTSEDAIQIHGGYGFTKEFPVERYYRDAQSLRARWLDEKHISPVHAHGSWYRDL